MQLHDGDILSAEYVRENFILHSVNNYLGVWYYISPDGNYCCQLYKDSIETQIERYE